MHLVQFLIPLYDRERHRFASSEFQRVYEEITTHFGGVTAYTRAPAQGGWEDEDGRVHHDDVIVMEVIVDTLDRAWWAAYKRDLETRFHQDTLIVRAMTIELL